MNKVVSTVRVRKTITTRVTVETAFKFSTRLSHSSDEHSGIQRERLKTGFRYRSRDGKIIRDPATLARIRAIVIPPAWENVWICPSANGHLQATGRDARGRKQYRYHPAFRFSQDCEKFERLAAFGKALPRIRTRVKADLSLPGLPREKVLAAVVKLLDQTHLRVGNAEYVKANKSFGLSTLQDRHVSFSGMGVWVRFRGKSGVWHERKISDRVLARIVRSCRDIPGQHLFQYRDADRKPHRIGSAEVNEYIREISGGSYTAKDFRTWAGTVAAMSRLARMPIPESDTDAAKIVVGVVEEVAAELGNTPSVCRKSYIHPRVLEAFASQSLPYNPRPVGLPAAERNVLKLLV